MGWGQLDPTPIFYDGVDIIMEKSELQDMDLVYTRDKALFWVLYSKWYNELCLFNYNLDCIRRMSEYNTDLTHKDDMRNDIVGVIRVNSWYNMNKMREYADCIERGIDPEFMFKSVKKAKWLWYIKNAEIISAEKLESMIFYTPEYKANLRYAENYFFHGKDIKEEVMKLHKHNCVLWGSLITREDINYFVEHYIESEFTISDEKRYIMFFDKEGRLTCKRIDDSEEQYD